MKVQELMKVKNKNMPITFYETLTDVRSIAEVAGRIILYDF